MSRPAVELADIVRAHVGTFVQQNSWLNYQHLTVLRAIARCRTADLGGHIDHCTGCGYHAVSYNSCLMVSNRFWGVEARWRTQEVSRTRSDSPLTKVSP